MTLLAMTPDEFSNWAYTILGVAFWALVIAALFFGKDD